jgi:DNA-binding CsgD family transcriptional regulator/tetratricopeptide (TPR) repeat protein
MQPEIDNSAQVSPDFFGRRAETKVFTALLDHARDEGVALILLAGEPGIGKTRLAEKMAALAGEAGFLTAWGRWREGAWRSEYWVWGQALRGLLRAHPPASLGPGLDSALSELSSILPEIRERMPGLPAVLEDTGEQKRLRLLDAVGRLLERCCERQPVLLVFDNLHLAAAASLDLLAGILGEGFTDGRKLRLKILATYRDLPAYRRDPLVSFLAEAGSLRCARELHLEALSAEETRAMANHLLDRNASAVLLDEVWERTRGMPLFIQETCRLLQRRSGGTAAELERTWKQRVPEALNHAIHQRVRCLSAGGAAALREAAAVGETFLEEELQMAGCGADPQAAMEEAIDHGFLQCGDSPGEYHFAHPLVHAAIRLQLPAPRRRALCTKLAEAVEREYRKDLQPWALRLARWWGETPGALGRARVRRYLRMAAESALAAGAWDEATSLYCRIEGLDGSAADPEEAAAVWQGQGTALYRTGRHEKGIGLLQKAFALYKQLGRLENMVSIATEQVYLLVGQPGFHDFFVEVLPFLPPGSVAEAQVLHFYGVAQILSIGDYPRAAELFHRALEIGESAADPIIQARNLAGLGFVDNAYGRYADCEARALRALELSRAAPDPYSATHASYVLSTALIGLGRGWEAVPYEDRGLEITYLVRDGVQIASGCQLRTRQEVMSGNWDEAVRLCDQGLTACPDHLFLLALRAFMAYTRGEFAAGDAFRGRILAVQKQTPSGPWRAHIQAASTAAVRARNSGEITGLGRYVPLLRSIASHPRAHPFILHRAHLLLAFLAALTGDDRLARNQHQEILKLPPLQLVRPYLKERFLGLAAHCFGDHGRAVAHLESALRLVRSWGDRPLEGWILCELGEALSPAAGGEAHPARRHLLEARELACSLSMPPLQERAEGALQRLSELDGCGSPAHAHLSERERQVLSLVAAGRTNRAAAAEMGISANTVANHLRSILEKLGAANRTEAADRARKLGLL